MTDDLKTLERRALELMKLADFGDEAVRVNTAILDQSPASESAWTRLGRCHLEQRDFDEAVTALRSALALNPRHSVATNLLNEVRRRRAMTPTAKERATSGFAAREFALLETLPPADAIRALQTRIAALFDAVNATSIAAQALGVRRRHAGESGAKLFHANSIHAGDAGHIFAFQHGGRWEPQLNIGWFSAPPHPASAVRIGIGFKAGGRETDAAERERVMASFDRFQRTLAKSWARELAGWMSANGGFIQYGANPPAVDLQPERAVEWLLHDRALAVHGWIFVGRWLFLNDGDGARILGDRAKLASAVDDTFRTLFPLWTAAFADLD
jgi:tetratricopeptide (TPR) repeat protein